MPKTNVLETEPGYYDHGLLLPSKKVSAEQEDPLRQRQDASWRPVCDATKVA